MTERLSSKGVGYVYLYNRSLYCLNRIGKRYRGMGVGTCIENHTIVVKSYLVELADKFTFAVALKIGQRDIRVGLLPLGKHFFKRLSAID